LNAVLVSTCVWTEFVAAAPRIICWIFVGAAWTIAAGYWVWHDRQRAAISGKTEGQTFGEALAEYLKGNWFEAERRLNALLRRDEHDIEARLLLATLLRHTKRFDEATHQLNILAGLDGAQRWALEIHREGELLMEARERSITSENSELTEQGR
jgi:thioredoxin-like negative regulator of GroEL